jgi:hypothetical protein
VDGGDNAIIAGSFQSTVNFGGFALGEPLLTSAGVADIFVAKYDPAGGYRWSKRYGSSGDDSVLAMDADAGGNIAVTGYFAGSVDFGGGPLTSAGSRDVFFAKFDAAGRTVVQGRAG